jgi:predicted component of type VI protein secretion system
MNAAIAIETADVVDAFRAAEKETWDSFMREPTPENLLAHHSALRLLNREIESRVQAMLELGRVRTSGRTTR